MSDDKSSQLDNLDAVPPVLAEAGDVRGKLRVIRATYTMTGSETNGYEVELCRLPHGVRVTPLGQAWYEALGSDVKVSIGYDAHTARDGTTTAKDVDAFLAATAATSAGMTAIKPAAKADVMRQVDTSDEYVSIIAAFTQTTSINTTAGKVLEVLLVVSEN